MKDQNQQGTEQEMDLVTRYRALETNTSAAYAFLHETQTVQYSVCL